MRNLGKLKTSMEYILTEWLGHDLPEPETEDYDFWQLRRSDIEHMNTKDDAIDFLMSFGQTEDEAEAFLNDLERSET